MNARTLIEQVAQGQEPRAVVEAAVVSDPRDHIYTALQAMFHTLPGAEADYKAGHILPAIAKIHDATDVMARYFENHNLLPQVTSNLVQAVHGMRMDKLPGNVLGAVPPRGVAFLNKAHWAANHAVYAHDYWEGLKFFTSLADTLQEFFDEIQLHHVAANWTAVSRTAHQAMSVLR